MLYQNKPLLGMKLTLCSAAICVGIWQCQAGPTPSVTLTDGNSVALIDTSSQAGMFNWSVNGINQLNQQWFWFRTGSAGPEHSIDTLGAPTIVSGGAKSATVTYTSSGQFSISTTYTLRGGAPVTSGASDIGESIVIDNLSSAQLDFHFFQYADFSLGGTPANDRTQLGVSGISGLFNEAAVWDSALSLTENVGTSAIPGANHGEVAAIGTTLGELNDANPTTLSDVAGALGPSHNTWALEWDLQIANGGSAIISLDKNLQTVLVPEPSSLALISLGLIGYGLRRRKLTA